MQIRVLFDEKAINARIEQMGREISLFYQEKELLVVALANGGIPFAADLIRKISVPLLFDSLAVESYHMDKRGEKLHFRGKMKLSPQGRHVLILDEVLDSGNTLKGTVEYMYQHGAADVRTAVIVQKHIPRDVQADWAGFMVPDVYLVGYGMDSKELYRNLPYIGCWE